MKQPTSLKGDPGIYFKTFSFPDGKKRELLRDCEYGMFEKLQNALNKLGALMYVKNPLLLFATLVVILGLELHHALDLLKETGVYGFGAIGIVAYLLRLTIVTVGSLTEKTPTHLYHDVELLKETMNNPRTLREIVDELVAKSMTQRSQPRFRVGDCPADIDKYLLARSTRSVESSQVGKEEQA